MPFRVLPLALLLLAASACPAATAQPDPGFHLYLLIGQSNMAGTAKPDAESAADPRVLMLTKELTWVPATDPMHFGKGATGVGPGLAFAKRMAAANPKARIGLIPGAVCGSSIKVWVPGAADAGTQTHPYDDAVARTKEAMKSGVLKGILWHQGESDRGKAGTYGAQLTELVARLRQDLAAPQVPFVAGEIASFKPQSDESTAAFNAALAALQPRIKRFAVISAEKTTHKGDSLHFDAASARLMGGRFADAMLALQKTP